MTSLLKKLTYSIFTMFLAITTLFFIIRLAPGDPIEKILGPEAPLEQIELYRNQLGLNNSVSIQYLNFLLDAMKLDLGKSLFKRKLVKELISIHLPPTMILAFLSIFFSTIIGTVLGVLSAVYKSQPIDKFLRIITLLSLAFPIFSLAPLLVLIFSIQLNLLPVSEWTSLKHIFLPVLTLTIPLSSVIARITRNKFLEERNAPWVTVLDAKGLSPLSIILRITKVCLPTILNVMAIQLSVVLAGTIITETIFDIPGVGSLLFEGIQNRDYPLVQGVVVYSTIIYMAIYFIIDYLNEIIDPRLANEK